jgi:sigma-B regulation protein RsbU (phosphoserine phosphatase)
VKGTLTYINGGHEEPIIVSADGKIKSILSPTGPAMGMMADMDFDIKLVKLKPGDLLMTYTDGVPDARAPSRERFGKDRLRAILESQPITSAVDVLDRIMKPVTAFIADADQFDDITMLAVWYKPNNSEVPDDAPAKAKNSILSQLDL